MRLWFHIIEGIKGIKKARLASVLSITSFTLMIILLAVFAIFFLNLNTWIGSFREKVELEIFLHDGVSDNQINEIKSRLINIPGILDLKFISKKDAADRFKKEFGQDIFEVLDSNPLPPSFIVTLDDSARNLFSIKRISSKVENLPFVDEVVYQQLLLESIDKYIYFIYLGALIVGLFILVIAVALIYNTVRLTIYARRETIFIMRLVGATQRFIRGPFLVEGIVQGLISSLIASVIIYYLIEFVRHFIYPFLIFNNYIFIFLISFGIIIGLLSAAMGVAKFLKSI